LRSFYGFGLLDGTARARALSTSAISWPSDAKVESVFAGAVPLVEYASSSSFLLGPVQRIPAVDGRYPMAGPCGVPLPLYLSLKSLMAFTIFCLNFFLTVSSQTIPKAIVYFPLRGEAILPCDDLLPSIILLYYEIHYLENFSFLHRRASYAAEIMSS
jgi:hypothetical protein